MGARGFSRDIPRGHPADALAEFERRRRAERDRVETVSAKPIAGPLVDAINNFAAAAHPLERKEKLAAYVKSRVRDENFSVVNARRVAEYVVFDAWPVDELEAVLNELDTADRSAKIRGTRGAWLHGAILRRIAARGIKERKRRKLPPIRDRPTPPPA